MINPNAQEYYNKTNVGYEKKWSQIDVPSVPSQFFRKLLNDQILEMGDVQNGEKVIEIGCGTGLILRELIKRTSFVFGVDISIGMLERAKDNLSKNISVNIVSDFKNINSQQKTEILLKIDDFRNLDLPIDYFDKIFSTEVLRYIDDISPCLKKVQSIMRPETIFIFTITNSWSFGLFPLKYQLRKVFGLIKKDELHQFFITERTLRKKLKEVGLEIVEFKKYGLLTANPFFRKFIGSERKFRYTQKIDDILSRVFPINKFFDTFVVVVRILDTNRR